MNTQEYEELEYVYTKQLLEESITTYNKLAEQASFHTILIVGVVVAEAYGLYHFVQVDKLLMSIVFGVLFIIGLVNLYVKVMEEQAFTNAAQKAEVELQTLISDKTQADIKKKIMEYEQEEINV